MSEKEDFAQRIANYTPVPLENAINLKEVSDIEAWFNKSLSDHSSKSLLTSKNYSRDFINQVIELAEKNGHVVPKAMFNIIGRNDKRQRLWATRDLGEIAYLYNYYNFVSKADALDCKRQLQKLKEQMSQKENPDKSLMDNIKRALADVEKQLKEFDNLSR